jgi:hypothetical protein
MNDYIKTVLATMTGVLAAFYVHAIFNKLMPPAYPDNIVKIPNLYYQQTK